MKACASCGSLASQGVRRCLSCGSASFLYVCENCATRFTTSHCPQCGVLHESHEKVCPNCGRHSFDTHCPDCGRTLRDVAPIRADIPLEAFSVHAGEGVYTSDEFDKVQQRQKKKESGCGITALVLSLIGYWCAQDIGLPGLSFLVPALIFFAIGLALAKTNNRRTWSLIASGVILALSALLLAFAPSGWGK